MKIELLCKKDSDWKKEAVEDIKAALDKLNLSYDVDFSVNDNYEGPGTLKIDNNDVAYIEKGGCVGNNHYFFKTDEEYYYDAKEFLEAYLKKRAEEVEMEDLIK